MRSWGWLFAAGLCLAPAQGQVEEIPLTLDNVEVTVGEWDYETFAVPIGGRLFRGYGCPLGAAAFNIAGFDRFRAWVGARDGATATAQMSIEVDGKVVWRGRPRVGDAPKAIEIALTGHRELLLRGTSDTCLYAEPRLVHGLPMTGNATAAQPAGGVTATAGDVTYRVEAPVEPPSGSLARRKVYHNSFAVIFTVGKYAKLPEEPRLRHGAADAQALRDLLVGSYGFPPENVYVLSDEHVKRETIRRALAFLADSKVVQPEDRILFYFAGWTQTLRRADGQEAGFLLPYDADVDLADPNAEAYQKAGVALKTVWEHLEFSPAKHKLVVFDACVGGTGATPAAAGPAAEPGELAGRPALQVLTAGGPGQRPAGDAAAGDPFAAALLATLRSGSGKVGNVGTTTQLWQLIGRSMAAVSAAWPAPQLGSRGTDGEFLFTCVPPFASLAEPEPKRELTEEPGPPTEGPGGHWYQAVAVAQGVTWSDARRAAEQRKLRGLAGHLVSITSAEEWQFILDSFPDAVKGGYWLGGHQDVDAPDYREPARGWGWITGEPWEFTAWNQQPVKEPNDLAGNDQCLALIQPGGWNDNHDEDLVAGYLVEYEPAAK